jgi:DGQHR domain-containing protein
MLRLPALALRQSPGRDIYAFGVSGKQVIRFATVSRAHRAGGDVRLLGYQRPEVQRHVAEIRAYVESQGAMLPNAIVLAFCRDVRFVEAGLASDGLARQGVLEIPLNGHGEPVGFVVDGQQRLAAIRDANVEDFPIFAVAFIADSDEEQREQFLLVNATKPLPRGLIHELLPGTQGRMPSHLQQRRLSARLVEILNYSEGSPLYRTIRTATNPAGRIADNSMLRVLENSLSDGALWEIKQVECDPGRAVERMVELVSAYWAAVRTVWSDIWDLKPRRSRLLHGAGVVSLGYLMEHMVVRRQALPLDEAYFVEELRRIAPECRWTEGWWEFGSGQRRRWDEVQNVSKDVMMLANHLTRKYRGLEALRWGVRDAEDLEVVHDG